ncbi:type IV toxin-antitoxin system AbiEi family antitoxin domain-containing protein [Mucilaginibacter paludis]|uniref:Transcriptional regulator, AbiEi antitoxin, Type IV TA system n=1 Tax=Mucilaginibacter paludis DSM 18603 TaxID=714943 RepID=H1Y4R9_9SPHI|nr:hypothetical protein [Mucilaginibacter paludis]EHQ28113.1 hypothetical protein Mucpa_4022 [Mucilaginibacter paludis DSM 18603]
MTIDQVIYHHSTQPLTHQLLTSWLKDYKRPNDKINALKSEGLLSSVKKGLYIAGEKIHAIKPETTLMANHILGPSYVSVDTALSYYGLIPERVYEIASMTTKASREFNTPMGVFTYTHLPLPYYSFGLRTIKLLSEQYAIVASPEKALCDKIVTTSGLTLRSMAGAYSYLVDNLRMDETALKEFNTPMMEEWINNAPKKESLLMVIKTIDSL